MAYGTVREITDELAASAGRGPALKSVGGARWLARTTVARRGFKPGDASVRAIIHPVNPPALAQLVARPHPDL